MNNYRERYEHLVESECFKKHYADKSLGEVIEILDDIVENQKDIPEEFTDLVNRNFWDLVDNK